MKSVERNSGIFVRRVTCVRNLSMPNRAERAIRRSAQFFFSRAESFRSEPCNVIIFVRMRRAREPSFAESDGAKLGHVNLWEESRRGKVRVRPKNRGPRTKFYFNRTAVDQQTCPISISTALLDSSETSLLQRTSRPT